MIQSSILSTRGLRAVIDAIPSPVFIVETDMRIAHANTEGFRFLGESPERVLKRVCGDALHCVNAMQADNCCGTTEFCCDCIIRNSFDKAVASDVPVRNRGKFRLMLHGTLQEVHFAVTASPFEFETTRYVIIVLYDVTELVALRAILPICANCKKIRNDDRYWEQVEEYLKKHMDLNFTHSICPDCVEKLYPGLALRQET